MNEWNIWRQLDLPKDTLVFPGIISVAGTRELKNELPKSS